jgi:seryl-tRNA synthetase
MMDRRFIREHPDLVQKAAELKGVPLDLDELLQLDHKVRSLQGDLDRRQAEKKALSRRFAHASPAERDQLRDQSTMVDQHIGLVRAQLADATTALTDLLLMVPAQPWEGAPVGPNETYNQVISTVGQRPEFDFQPLDHVTLVERRGWAEFRRARNVAGERAYALLGDLLLLERAVHSYALDVLSKDGFVPISVPSLVRESALVGTGMLPKGREEIYELPADNLFLAGTAEVALIGLYAGEILHHADLPLCRAGISPCFRREIGSASRDVRGLLRVHQFEKVEQFVICAADENESARWHNRLLATAERLLQELELHYQVVECATGDMGLGKYRMNDINTWFPSLQTYRETHSCSTLHDWQARRANIRYRDTDGTIRYAHTLNNTAVATPRLLAALIENHQRSDTSVHVPNVLRPYLGGRASI